MDPKLTLASYLQDGRDALLWKLDGLSPYDARRPLTPTGTSLLGLVKHLTSCEYGYFGITFDRLPDDVPDWVLTDDDEDPNRDLYATAEESVDGLVAGYRAACANSDATIDALALDAEGSVPWWSPARRTVTLHQVLVHMIAETHRHAGHADLAREAIDGAAGLLPGVTNLPSWNAAAWRDHAAKLERIAQEATD
ncbi:DinB family protein [Propionicimonas sp.]|uniref:DinB family protein n=1 Tax=Propionicimonas sp. TaxID=1955623 RepID=UPI003D0B1082